MVIGLNYLLLIFLFISINIIPQEQEKINLKKNELSDLKDEISRPGRRTK